MRMKKFLLGLVALVNTCVWTSCDKEKEAPQTAVAEVSIDATDFSKWVYFSLEQGKVVTVANPESSLEWDLGFHFSDIRTNGGASGIGQGAAAETTLSEVNQTLPQLPGADAFKVDTKTFIIVQTHNAEGKHDIKRAEAGVNPILTTMQTERVDAKGEPVRGPNNTPLFEKSHVGAIDFSHGMGGAQFKLSNKVYLVRTAKGKYAKIKIIDYRDAHDKSVHVKMQFALVP